MRVRVCETDRCVMLRILSESPPNENVAVGVSVWVLALFLRGGRRLAGGSGVCCWFVFVLCFVFPAGD